MGASLLGGAAFLYTSGGPGAIALTPDCLCCRPAPPLSPPSAAASRSLAPQLAGAGGSRERLDAAALNASYFDADAYLRRMLREARLAELAARQRDMAAEVGSLDSDMQVRRFVGCCCCCCCFQGAAAVVVVVLLLNLWWSPLLCVRGVCWGGESHRWAASIVQDNR